MLVAGRSKQIAHDLIVTTFRDITDERAQTELREQLLTEAQAASRLKEAAKLGFTGAVVPESGRESGDSALKTQEIGSLKTLVAEIAANGRRKPAKSGGQDG